ncbi:MAG TPA: hypothetical protein VGM41_01950 [Chitinophagaceae bacterium]|jgi:hypothetical protein
MLSSVQKIQYLLDSALRFGEKVACTNCGSRDCTVIDRKYVFTRLFECNGCHLYFRHPVEKVAQNKAFYQEDYIEKDKITAELPGREELEAMKQNGFSHGNKNAERYHLLFKKLFPGSSFPLKVMDYGSSWGYTMWQLKQYGYDVEGFEISGPRAAYGEKNLGLVIHADEAKLRGDNDIFFSAHVIEHHPTIPGMIALAKKLLKNNGYFVAISPNGSEQYREIEPGKFHHAWGKVHPNYLNVDFYKSIFSGFPYYIGSNPFNLEQIGPLNEGQQVTGDLTGEELLVIVRFGQEKNR